MYGVGWGGVWVWSLYLNPHVDQDLLGLLAEGSGGEAEHDDLGAVDNLLELRARRRDVVVAGLRLGEGAARKSSRAEEEKGKDTRSAE